MYTYECWKRWRQRAQRKSFSGKPTSPHMEQTVAAAARDMEADRRWTGGGCEWERQTRRGEEEDTGRGEY